MNPSGGDSPKIDFLEVNHLAEAEMHSITSGCVVIAKFFRLCNLKFTQKTFSNEIKKSINFSVA